jgi:hypothetical protein
MASKRGKLAKLVEIEGYTDSLSFLEAVNTDSVVPGICKNDGCHYTTGVEPDSDSGWCEECQTNTVMSALILAGII